MSTPSQTAPEGANQRPASNGSHTTNDLKARLAALPRLPLIMAAAFCVAVIVALLLWGNQPRWSVLYRDLPAEDGGEIVTQLEQAGVPYRLSDQGATLEVPAEQVYRLRLTMAQQGLPSRGSTGFELMDTQAFGISQFTEHVNYQRALSGELSRTIANLEPVSSARVHLALPEDSVFVRERRPATASVVVELHRGQRLKDRQIQAIQHLVAGSVQGLASEDITVVDQDGNPLSRPPGDTLNLDGSALEYAQELEKRYQSRINALLAPILGRDNFRAEVSAQLDFSHSEQTEELYSPNQASGSAAIRSTQLNNVGVGEIARIGGVPGALSNTPPGNAVSPLNAESQQDDGPADQDTAASTGGNYQHNSIINYELDKVVRHTRERLGRLDKLSVAVVVNHQGVTDTNGNIVSRSLDEQALEQIKTLVRQAMGYNEQRGDSLSVVSVPFVATARTAEVSDDIRDWWQTPEFQTLAIELGRYLLILIVAWILYRKLLKPLLLPQQSLQSSSLPIGQPSAPLGDAHLASGLRAGEPPVTNDPAGIPMPSSGLGAPDDGSNHQHNLKKAQDMAREDPRLVAMILKNWMSHHE